MINCRYCDNYHLNSHERVDDCCLGQDDCRKDCFNCNDNLKPKKKKECSKIVTDCRYCDNYHLNSRERIDDCCLGQDDCRKKHFNCNNNLKPKVK